MVNLLGLSNADNEIASERYTIVRSAIEIAFPSVSKGPFIATQLNSTRRRVELSCVAIDTLTGLRRSELIGESCSRCRVELCRRRYRHFADATQLNSN